MREVQWGAEKSQGQHQNRGKEAAYAVWAWSCYSSHPPQRHRPDIYALGQGMRSAQNLFLKHCIFLKKHLSTLYNPGTEGSTGYTGTNRKDWSLRVNGRRISKRLKTTGCRQHGMARAGFAGVRSASESPFHVLLEP